MPNEYESSVYLQSALSVAHDLVDTISQLKSELKIKDDLIDRNVASYKAILDERERQINALTNECAIRDSKIKDETSSHSELTGKVNSLQQQNDQLNKDRNNLLNTVRELKASYATMETDKNTWHKTALDLEKEIDKLQGEITKLKDELDYTKHLIVRESLVSVAEEETKKKKKTSPKKDIKPVISKPKMKEPRNKKVSNDKSPEMGFELPPYIIRTND